MDKYYAISENELRSCIIAVIASGEVEMAKDFLEEIRSRPVEYGDEKTLESRG